MQTLQKITVPNPEMLSLAHITGEYDDPICRYIFQQRRLATL